MVDGDYDMVFSETWGAPYDPHSYVASWTTPDEAHYSAMQGLSGRLDPEVFGDWVDAILSETDAAKRQANWTELLSEVHEEVSRADVICRHSATSTTMRAPRRALRATRHAPRIRSTRQLGAPHATRHSPPLGAHHTHCTHRPPHTPPNSGATRSSTSRSMASGFRRSSQLGSQATDPASSSSTTPSRTSRSTPGART